MFPLDWILKRPPGMNGASTLKVPTDDWLNPFVLFKLMPTLEVSALAARRISSVPPPGLFWLLLCTPPMNHENVPPTSVRKYSVKLCTPTPYCVPQRLSIWRIWLPKKRLVSVFSRTPPCARMLNVSFAAEVNTEFCESGQTDRKS